MKRLSRLIAVLLTLFIVYLVLTVVIPNLDKFPGVSPQERFDNLQNNLDNLEASFERQRLFENMARQQQWRMQHPTLPDSYNPNNYFAP